MDKMIYVAMNGARSTLLRQDNIAANLANASTPGYRASTLAFRAVAAEAIQKAAGAAGGSAAVDSRVYSLETTAGADFSPGPIQRTGRNLDVAIDGEGWFAVQGRDGREAYTRAGAFEINAEGVLQASGGRPVLSDGGPIVVPPDAALTIGRDGTLSAITGGQPLSEVQVLGRLKLVNPPVRELQRGDDGLFRTANGRPAAADERVALSPGALEGSNVNPVEAMVGMITVARQFELQMKLLQHAEANSRAAGQLMQMNG